MGAVETSGGGAVGAIGVSMGAIAEFALGNEAKFVFPQSLFGRKFFIGFFAFFGEDFDFIRGSEIVAAASTSTTTSATTTTTTSATTTTNATITAAVTTINDAAAAAVAVVSSNRYASNISPICVPSLPGRHFESDVP